MSSKKDFISIDELFQGLKNGEEDMPAGAWSKMEGILNDQMPIGGTRLSRNYKFIIPILAILLLGASVYLWNQKIEIKSETSPSQTGNHQEKTPSIELGKNHFADSKDENETLSGKYPMLASNAKELPEGSKKRHAEIVIAETSQKNKGKTEFKNSNLTKQQAVAVSRLTNHQTHAKFTPLKESSAQNQIAATQEEGTGRTKPFIKTPIKVQKIIEVIKGDSTGKELALNDKATFQEIFTPQGQYNNDKIVRNEEGQLFKEEKNTFKRIELQRSHVKPQPGEKLIFQIDTISIVRIQQLKYTPLNELEALGVHQLTLASANQSSASISGAKLNHFDKANLVPLSNFKVKSKKVKPMDAIKNTAGGFADYFDGSHPLYLAMMLGGNTSLGNPGSYGMQIGLAALYSLGERWTLSAEFRFANKYFPQFSFLDQQSTFQIQKEQTPEGWLYTGTENTINRNYVVKNMNLLNLPVYLSYNFNDRLSILGGINFSYGLPLKWKKENSFSQVNIHQIRNENENPFQNSLFQINEKEDFKSRFGVGYVAGLNYELSRKFSLDGRITQNFWSNSSKNLPELNNIFHNASFELSLGIYFGRKEKVVYIMDKR